MRIVIATKEHAEFIADNMRVQDIEELSKVDQSPLDALIAGLESDQKYTVIHNNNPVMMFGLVADGFSTAIVWALGTEELLDMRKEFISESLRWRDIFLQRYSILHNYIDVDNTIAIRWLQYLGAKFSNPEPRGNGTFMRFELHV